jgi:hypothetical protein
MKLKNAAPVARKVVKVVRAARGLVQLVADAADWIDEHVLGEDKDDGKEPGK